MPHASKFWHSAWGLVTGTIGFFLAFFLVHLPHGPEHWSSDLQTAWLSDRLASQHPRIAIVEITEDTLRDDDYVSPVDRGVLANVVRTLIDADVKVIGLDFIFDRHTEPVKDAALLAAIKDQRAQIILGALDEPPSTYGSDFQSKFLADAGRPVGHLYYAEHQNPLVISDQVVREMADPKDVLGRKSFTELLARAGGSYRAPESLNISWLRPPKNGRQTFLTLSGDDVLGRGLASPLPLKQMLSDKIVLIGGNFADRDQHLTPFSVVHGDWYPGIFIHAQILADMIDPSRQPIRALGWPLWLLLIFGAACGGFFTGRSPKLAERRPWVEIGAVIAFIVIGVLAFAVGRFLFPFVAAMLGWGWGEMAGHWEQHRRAVSQQTRGSHHAT